jgi:hypothetical protein
VQQRFIRGGLHDALVDTLEKAEPGRRAWRVSTWLVGSGWARLTVELKVACFGVGHANARSQLALSFIVGRVVHGHRLGLVTWCAWGFGRGQQRCWRLGLLVLTAFSLADESCAVDAAVWVASARITWMLAVTFDLARTTVFAGSGDALSRRGGHRGDEDIRMV